MPSGMGPAPVQFLPEGAEEGAAAQAKESDLLRGAANRHFVTYPQVDGDLSVGGEVQVGLEPVSAELERAYATLADAQRRAEAHNARIRIATGEQDRHWSQSLAFSGGEE